MICASQPNLCAAELIRKGCTSCFDLFIELPGPTVEGIHAVAEAYQGAGLRAVVAPNDRRPDDLSGLARTAGAF